MVLQTRLFSCGLSISHVEQRPAACPHALRAFDRKAAAPLRLANPSPGLLLLSRLEGYYGQFADSLELLCHFHMLVFAPDPRCFVAGDRIRNPLGNIAVE